MFLNDSNIKKWGKVFFTKENQETIATSFIDDYIILDSNQDKDYPELLKEKDLQKNKATRGGICSRIKNSKILTDLVDKKYRLQIFIVILLNLLNQLTGINVFQLYSTKVFINLGYSNPENLTIALGFMHLCAGLITNQMIERFGRKTLISLGFFLLCICFIGMLSSLIFTLHFLGLVFIFGYKVTFCMAAGGSIMVYQSEILPAHLIPFGITFQSIFVIVVSYTTLPLINSFGIFALFSVFLGFGMIGFILFYGYAVETKRKKDSVVVKEFMNKKFWS